MTELTEMGGKISEERTVCMRNKSLEI